MHAQASGSFIAPSAQSHRPAEQIAELHTPHPDLEATDMVVMDQRPPPRGFRRTVLCN